MLTRVPLVAGAVYCAYYVVLKNVKIMSPRDAKAKNVGTLKPAYVVIRSTDAKPNIDARKAALSFSILSVSSWRYVIRNYIVHSATVQRKIFL